jgi:predicted transcriptional regulator
MPEFLPLNETSKIVLRAVFDGATNPEAIADSLTGTERQLTSEEIAAGLSDLGQRWLVTFADGELVTTEDARENRDAWLS